jgi:hypothetical protein
MFILLLLFWTCESIIVLNETEKAGEGTVVLFLISCPPPHSRIVASTIWLSRATHHPPPATPVPWVSLIAPR